MPTSKSSFAAPILTFLILLVGMGLFSCSPDTSLSNSAELDRGGVAGIPADHFKPLSFRDLSPDATAAKIAGDDLDDDPEDDLDDDPEDDLDDDPKDDLDDDLEDDLEYEEPKPRTVTEFISAEDGGQVKLDWEIKDEDGDTGSAVKAELMIFPDALDEDAEITIGLLNPAYAMVGVDLKFGEHGTSFRIPAELSLDLKGLDLSDFDKSSTLDLYFYDPLSDAWFPVPRDEDKIDVKLDKGDIKGIWYLPHFSRYSLSGGR
jgi:hypothetical protein